MKLSDLAKEYGAANLRFFIPMTRLEMAGIIPGIAFKSSNSPVSTQECVVDEGRYKVDENYKITLRAINPSYGIDSYYQSDLETLLSTQPNAFQAYVLNIDGYQHIPFKD